MPMSLVQGNELAQPCLAHVHYLPNTAYVPASLLPCTQFLHTFALIYHHLYVACLCAGSSQLPEMTADKLHSLLNDPSSKVVLVDVRTPEEQKVGQHPSAALVWPGVRVACGHHHCCHCQHEPPGLTESPCCFAAIANSASPCTTWA